MFSTHNLIATKFFIVIVFFLNIGLLDAQWAGSSSPAGSSNINTSVMKSNTSDGTTKV